MNVPAAPPLWPASAVSLATLLHGTLHGDPQAVGLRVVTDSRAGVRAQDVFLALRGPHFDGVRFAARAVQDGASIVIAHGPPPPSVGSAASWIEVPDTLDALQTLAARARLALSGPVLAITGSNGKTIVKDLLVAAVGGSLRVEASPASWNSQVGVARSLLGFTTQADLYVVECGISRPDEMESLAAMVRPDLGLVTNVGDVHLQDLGNREGVARHKRPLFLGIPPSGWVLVPEDDPLACVVAGPRAVPLPMPASAASAIQAVAQRNEALVLAAAVRLGVAEEHARAGLRAGLAGAVRVEVATTPRGVVLLNDAYSSDPVSAELALLLLVREGAAHRTLAVLGAMAQLGSAQHLAHVRLGQRAAQLGVGRVLAVGPDAQDIARAAQEAGMTSATAVHVPTVQDALLWLDEVVREGDRVLLKGSQTARLDRIAQVWLDELSAARVQVDLDQIVRNAQVARRTAQGVGVMAVVKAFGYGLDAVRLARALEDAPVDYFAVAYADEGVQLRERGIVTPILVQNPLPHEFAKVARFGLTAEVGDPGTIAPLAAAARRQGVVLRVHLKVETGMSRAGVAVDDVAEAARAILQQPSLLLEGLMTHFAASDEPQHDEFSHQQLARFDAAIAAARDVGAAPRWIHAANSVALARFPAARYSMVRLGIGMFGYAEVDGERVDAQLPALRLVTRVVQVRTVPPGAAVGYGLTWRTNDTARSVAVVGVGYADGYPRALSNRGWMTVHGARCPVVGRVCMDVTMLDVTDVPVPVRAGDEVVVWGPDPQDPQLPALAALADTIPYELLTRLAPRVRRIFHWSHGAAVAAHGSGS